MGRVAGENIGRSVAGDPGGADGGPARFGGVLGTAVTRFAANGVHVEIGRTGPTTQQALDSGRDVASLVTESTTASGYMPQASPIAVKVLAEKGSRRLLGVQVVGGPGSAKRVDTAAAAIWLHGSVDDVAAMDLSYAPPFSPVLRPGPDRLPPARRTDLTDPQGGAAGDYRAVIVTSSTCSV